MGKRKNDASNKQAPKKKKIALTFPGRAQVETTQASAVIPTPDPAPPAPPGVVLVPQCPHPAHDPLCTWLQNTLAAGGHPHLTVAEFNAHGCCGRSGTNGATCAAFPAFPVADLLTPVLNNPSNHLGPVNNEGTRWRMYTQWCTVCSTQNWLHDHPFEVSATTNVTRYKWSSCVLVRIRTAFPNLPGVAYRGFNAT
jgi:hypothetical protein